MVSRWLRIRNQLTNTFYPKLHDGRPQDPEPDYDLVPSAVEEV